MPAIEIVAVNQCSGNSRGFFDPRVAGGQLGNGAMGNARWRGVPLKAVLDKAGVQQGAQAGHLQRPGRAGQRQDAGFRQGARHRPRARRRGDAGLWHERRGPAVAQRLSAAARRARLLRHLLGQAPQRDHRHRQRVRRLLDEDAPTAFRTTPAPASSPAPRRRRRSRSAASPCAPSSPASPTAPSCRPASDRRCKGIAFDGGTGIKEVAVSTDGGKTWTPAQARPGSRQILVPRMDSCRSSSAGRRARAQGARHQQWRRDAADRRRCGIRPATCATSSKPFASRRPEENDHETLELSSRSPAIAVTVALSVRRQRQARSPTSFRTKPLPSSRAPISKRCRNNCTRLPLGRLHQHPAAGPEVQEGLLGGRSHQDDQGLRRADRRSRRRQDRRLSRRDLLNGGALSPFLTTRFAYNRPPGLDRCAMARRAVGC